MPLRLLTVSLALLALTPTLAAADTLHRTGPAEDRFDLVLLADGYRSEDRGDFEREAGRVLEGLRGAEPFSRYLGLMNVHTGFRPSASSGTGGDTAYGTHFPQSGRTTLRATRTTLLLGDAVRAGGEADAVLVIVNSGRRGGTAIGSLCFVTRGAGPRVALHELGHAIGRLGDEYSSWAGSPTRSREAMAQAYPNLTTATTREQLPWKDWVARSASVPAHLFSSGVSAYRGGGAYSSGIYRPSRSCRMRRDHAAFCAVCRQELVLAIYAESSPLKLVHSGSGSSRRARLVGSMPGDTWATRWTGVQGSGLEATVPSGASAHVVVEDATPWVRGADPRRRLLFRFDASSGAGGVVSSGHGSGQVGQPGRVVGVSSRLRVRSGPSATSAILGHLAPGAAVRVTGPAQGGFYPIAYNDGTGYVGRNYVRLDGQRTGLSQVLTAWR
jgi:hypothetical protein